MEAFVRAVALFLSESPPFAPHLQVIVALWLVFSLIAFSFNTMGWVRRRAILQRAQQRRSRDSRAYVLAVARHEAELLGVIVQLSFVVIGLIVVASPSPVQVRTQTASISDLLVAPMLLVAQIITAIGSWRQRRYDVRIAMLPPARTLADLEIGSAQVQN